MNRKAMEYIIVVGCGRTGSHLANLLSKAGKSVVIIDREEDSFKRLDEEFSGFMMEADASEVDVLEQAKISKADALIIATDNDSTNMMIAQIGKKIYQVPLVMARIIDPAELAVYESLGIQTISPTIISAQILFDLIMDKHKED